MAAWPLPPTPTSKARARGAWVPRLFLLDTAHPDANGKWPISVARFPDGWSSSKVASAANLPPPGQALIDIIDTNASGLPIAKAYRILDDAG